MLKRIVFFSLIVLPFLSLADAIEDMTYEQAVWVQQYLKANPFVLDYCDCCGVGSASVVYVESMEIVDCSYVEGKYSVKVQGPYLYNMYTGDSDDPEIELGAPEIAGDRFNGIISLNYFFGISTEGHKAMPLGTISGFWTEHTCKGYTFFPKPIEDNAYAQWYNNVHQDNTPKSVVDYYRLMSDETAYFYSMIEQDGKWMTRSNADYELEATVDTKNGFIELFDEGTGGGGIRLQVVLYRMMDGSALIAVGKQMFDGLFTRGSLYFVKYENGAWLPQPDVFPNVSPQSFVKNGEEWSQLDFPYISYDLPQNGSTISASVDVDYLRGMCTEEQKKIGEYDTERCPFLDMVGKETLEIKWNKAEGKFRVK